MESSPPIDARKVLLENNKKSKNHTKFNYKYQFNEERKIRGQRNDIFFRVFLSSFGKIKIEGKKYLFSHIYLIAFP